MAGGATAAEWIKPGSYVSIEMERLGHAGFHVNGQE
jgi:2-oxo-3-hexenedioate decarboxylase